MTKLSNSTTKATINKQTDVTMSQTACDFRRSVVLDCTNKSLFTAYPVISKLTHNKFMSSSNEWIYKSKIRGIQSFKTTLQNGNTQKDYQTLNINETQQQVRNFIHENKLGATVSGQTNSID
jgi:hypothetical protein